jgi:hypothetical protein
LIEEYPEIFQSLDLLDLIFGALRQNEKAESSDERRLSETKVKRQPRLGKNVAALTKTISTFSSRPPDIEDCDQ